MSVAVDLDALWEQLHRFGHTPFLVTASADAKPHVVSVPVVVDGDALSVPAGNTTRGNVVTNPAATLLWSAPDDADYCLIVDGTAIADDARIVITPTRAVLHRVAGANDALPSCVRLVPADKA